ncbi:hypothetical protein TOPH_04233 [Tolypocladium ophioglossoides CBS 100239]|uniref:Non-homologous end-joining factor 1 n=1 Tax=Tolypocladium ophioglossoides (strain CBS 100239) TaxID=1163406 RepID=A0A0L0NAA4_TOLOC|nr:hypothetical protein TOPH_04233 [Tolypocladium ophioglossoides CBS 100239]
MSSEDLTWRPLPLPPLPGLPVVLVSAEMGNSSYTVRVTDMANMWAESLERKAICMRGWSENTSIDPSDTPENMAKFLASLRAALDRSQPGHEDTSLNLSPATTADAGEDGLTLKMTCALPGFDPLKWPFHLKKLPPSSIATDLRQVESLVQVLKHKDAVLAKLSDKLEAMGTGMEHVFTALSGRRKVTRSVAEDKVKGLAPFDQREWKAELDDEIKGLNSAGDLVQSVFGGSGLEYGAMMEIDKSPALDNWWHGFKGTSQLAHRKRTQEIPPEKGRPATPVRSTNAEDDGDFQVQATPPHLRSAGKRKATSSAPPPDSASSTEDEDEDHSVIPDSNQPVAVSESTQKSEAKKATSRLGAIGGRKQSATPRSPTPEAKASGDARARQPADDSETASEASEDDATASVPRSSPPPAPTPAPVTGMKKGGLGKIGGAAPKTRSPEAEEPKEKVGAPAPRKLGVIGNKMGGGMSSAMRAQEDTGRGRASTRKEEASVEEEPRETSQDRADRRREELKRELEKKAAAGPAKKKRRF